MKNACRNTSIVVLTWLTVSSAAGAGLLNGDFEAPVEPGFGVNFSVPPAGFVWNLAFGNIEQVTSAYWQPSSGDQSLDLSGSDAGAIYQDFTFSSSGAWNIRFDLSANPDLFTRGDGMGSGFKTVRVDFGTPGLMTTLGTYSLDSAPRSISDMMWVTMTTPEIVVSDSVTYRLQFTSLDPGNAGPCLDNVQLQSVPEPGSVALLCSGLMVLFLHRRQRR